MNDDDAPAGAKPVRPLLVGLLDARGVEILPRDLLASARMLCDAIVAIADTTARSDLEAHPIVARVVDSSGDGDARNSLIAAATSLVPEWLIPLGTDERVDARDALALRSFLERTALPGFTYGLIDDSEPDGWSYRVVAFDFANGAAAGGNRGGIPGADKMVRTAVRIRRVGSTSDGDDAATNRRDSDPSPLLSGEPLARWMPRDPSLPALADAIGLTEDELDPDAPALSVIVCDDADGTAYDRARAIAAYESPEPFEVLVAGDKPPGDSAPGVGHVPCPARATREQMAAAGVAAARGDYVVVLPGGLTPAPNFLPTLFSAHDEEVHPAVAPAVRAGSTARSSWAAYLLDHAHELPTLPPGTVEGEPSVCSFDRDALLQSAPPAEDPEFPDDAWRRLGAHRAPQVVVTDPGVRGPLDLLRREYGYGRRTAARLLHQHRARGRRLLDRDGVGAALGWARTRRQLVASCVERWGDAELRSALNAARRMLWLGSVASAIGLWSRLLKPERGAARTLFGKPGVTIALAGLERTYIPEGKPGGRTDLLILVHVDLVDPLARVVAIPRDLYVEVPGYGPARINSAYHHGAVRKPKDPDAGAERLRETILQTLGVAVDEHVIMRLVGFGKLVDALGGIEVHVEHEIRDEYFSAFFSAGTQRLDGARALKYVQTRKADSDTYRRKRHLDVLLALMHEAKRLRSPARALRVLAAARTGMRTSIRVRRLISLARAGRRLSMTRIRMASLGPPVIRAGRTERGSEIYRGDSEAIKRFVRQALGLPSEHESERLVLLRPSVPRDQLPATEF